MCVIALCASFFLPHTCAIMLPLLSAAKIFMAIIYQQDSCRENSVCSRALNELTFHERPRVYWWAPVCLKVFFLGSRPMKQQGSKAEFTQPCTQTQGLNGESYAWRPRKGFKGHLLCQGTRIIHLVWSNAHGSTVTAIFYFLFFCFGVVLIWVKTENGVRRVPNRKIPLVYLY